MIEWKLIDEFCEECNKPLTSLVTRLNDFPCLCSECYDERRKK